MLHSDLIPAFSVRAQHDGVTYSHCKDVSLSLSTDTTEKSGTSQGAASEYLIGRQSWQVRIKQLIADDGDTVLSMRKLREGTHIIIRCTIGSIAVHGDGIVAKLKAQFDHKNSATADVTVFGHGPLIPEGRTGIEYDTPVVTGSISAPNIPASGGTSVITPNITAVSQAWHRYLYGAIVEEGVITDIADITLDCSLTTHDDGVTLTDNVITALSLGENPRVDHVCASVDCYYVMNGVRSELVKLNVTQLGNAQSVTWDAARLSGVPSLLLPAVGSSGTLTLFHGITHAVWSSGEKADIVDTDWVCVSAPSWLTVVVSDVAPDRTSFSYTASAQSVDAAQRNGTLVFSDGTHTLSCVLTQAAHTIYLPVTFITDASLYASGESVQVTACYVVNNSVVEHVMTSRISAATQQFYIPCSGRDLSEINLPLKWLRLEASHSPLGDVSMFIDGVSQDFEPKGSSMTYLYPTASVIPAALFVDGKVRVTIGVTGGLYNAPYIGTDGFWYVNGQKTDVKAQGPAGKDGTDGTPGARGSDGTTYFTHIAWADDANGTNFTTSNPSGRGFNCIGTCVDTSVSDPTSWRSYKWVWVKGDKGKDGTDGTDGTPGPPGPDGKTYYSHIAWANSADGTKDFSTTKQSGQEFFYMGTCITDTSPDPNYPSAYSWVYIHGEDGKDGDSFRFGDYVIDRMNWGTDAEGYYKDQDSVLKSYYEIDGSSVTIHYYNKSNVSLLVQSAIYMQYIHDGKLVNFRYITLVALSSFDIYAFTSHTPTGDPIYDIRGIAPFSKVLGFTAI